MPDLGLCLCVRTGCVFSGQGLLAACFPRALTPLCHFQVEAEWTMRTRKKKGTGRWSPAVPRTPTRCTPRPKAAAPQTVSPQGVRPCAAGPPVPRPLASLHRQPWLPLPGAVRLSAPQCSCDSLDLTGGFGSDGAFFCLVVGKLESLSQSEQVCAAPLAWTSS